MDYKIIDTAGQITAVIIKKIKIGELSQIARSIMDKNSTIEQVGYLQGNIFQMMGGELSINGLIAGAFVIGQSGIINGFNFQMTDNSLTITLPASLIINVRKNTVRL